MSHTVDLNRIRDIVLANQRAGESQPQSPRHTVVVDREGKILTGDDPKAGAGAPLSVVPQDTFHQPVPQVLTDAAERLAEALDGEVTGCERRVWNGVPLIAVDVRLPGGLDLLILATDHFPGLPPLALVTEHGQTRQLHLRWDLGTDPEERLLLAVGGHFHGRGKFRAVFGPVPGAALTTDPAVAADCGWERFYSTAPPAAEEAEQALHARSGGLLSRSLSAKHVLLAGLGSGGSYIAEQLVRAGVGELTLIDPDTVEPANLSRTTYRWEDVGLPKTLALARHLRGIRPDLRLQLQATTLGADGADALLRQARECHLLIALTDDPAAQSLLNHTAYLADVPAVFAGLYAGAKGGEVILCVPGRTPCYRCTTGGTREIAGYHGGGVRDRDYGTGRLAGETALGVDIHHLDSATVKLALSLLLRDTPDAALAAFAEDALRQRFFYLCLSMSPDYWFFPGIFGETAGQYAYQGVWLTAETHHDCPVCGDPACRATRLQIVPATIDPSQFLHSA